MPSPSVSVASMDSKKIFDVHVEQRRGLRQALRRRRGLSVYTYSTLRSSSRNPPLVILHTYIHIQTIPIKASLMLRVRVTEREREREG